MKCYLFEYGNLPDAKLHYKIQGYNTTLHPCKLKGFHIVSVRLSVPGYPILIEDERSDGIIEGSYFKLTENDLSKKDSFGSKAYRRKQVILENGTEAWQFMQQCAYLCRN